MPDKKDRKELAELYRRLLADLIETGDNPQCCRLLADLIETGDNPQCCICGYEIKIHAETDKELTRQDTQSFQIHEKWVCGTCGDEIRGRE